MLFVKIIKHDDRILVSKIKHCSEVFLSFIKVAEIMQSNVKFPVFDFQKVVEFHHAIKTQPR